MSKTRKRYLGMELDFFFNDDDREVKNGELKPKVTTVENITRPVRDPIDLLFD